MPYADKIKQAASARKHYLLNTAKLKERAKNFKIFGINRNRMFVLEYLRQHPCVDCKESDIIVLDFDHVSGEKRNTMSQLIRNSVSIETLKIELKKCVVRCANCHRRKTAIEQSWFKVGRQK